MYRKTCALLVLCLAWITISIGAIERVNVDGSGLAIGGYDPVAYFSDGKAVRGDAALTIEHEGAVYRFASQGNRDLFRAEPEKYLPAYGGYCAWAVGQGYKAGIDPAAWTIHEGRLYLNYSSAIRRRFTADIDAIIAEANRNWPGLAEE